MVSRYYVIIWTKTEHLSRFWLCHRCSLVLPLINNHRRGKEHLEVLNNCFSSSRVPFTGRNWCSREVMNICFTTQKSHMEHAIRIYELKVQVLTFMELKTFRAMRYIKKTKIMPKIILYWIGTNYEIRN